MFYYGIITNVEKIFGGMNHVHFYGKSTGYAAQMVHR